MACLSKIFVLVASVGLSNPHMAIGVPSLSVNKSPGTRALIASIISLFGRMFDMITRLFFISLDSGKSSDK